MQPPRLWDRSRELVHQHQPLQPRQSRELEAGSRQSFASHPPLLRIFQAHPLKQQWRAGRTERSTRGRFFLSEQRVCHAKIVCVNAKNAEKHVLYVLSPEFRRRANKAKPRLAEETPRAAGRSVSPGSDFFALAEVAEACVSVGNKAKADPSLRSG